MDAECLTIGSELVSGQTVNTNAAYLARRLSELGIRCSRQVSVPDERAIIVRSIREAMDRTPLLIISGGLGPTFDDVTMEALAEAIGRPLRRDPAVAKHVRAFCRRHQRDVTVPALRQADVPEGAAALPNPLGTAPGVWLSVDQTLLIALPGVPQELRAIMDGSVLPRLRRLRAAMPVFCRTIRTIGVVELDIQRRLKAILLPKEMAIGLYPNLRAVDIRLTIDGLSPASARARLLGVERQLRRTLGPAVYGVDEQSLESVIGERLVKKRWTLAVAESCTGGLVSNRLTDVPGSSRYLIGSVVAYHNRVKHDVLGVKKALLAAHGAVSEPAARAMAEGVRRRFGADIGMAITGIAGPGGGTKTKPVGLVYLAVADRRGVAAQQRLFHGDRLAIKGQAAQAALDVLRRFLLRRGV